jgi:hypothetical protein
VAERETELAMRVVNLRHALATANRQIERVTRSAGGTPLTVACRETGTPTFREGRKFWAEVRRLTGGQDGI